jgi:excinuclease ABC subunit A
VKVGEGDQARAIFEISHTTLRECFDYFQTLKMHGAKGDIAAKVVREIGLRLKFLNDVGLNYLSLDRSAETSAVASRSASAWPARSARA